MRLSSGTWPVRVDPGQLEAAILALAINARDAMPNGGTLRLETRNALPADRVASGALEGDFVALTVSDTGTGIPPEILDKVFEPFFTTREVGAGSGLGLSMVQGFARQSAGTVCIDSVVGRGTAVTLFLPRTAPVIEAGMIEAGAGDEAPGAGQGTVLLVDDDEDVRVIAAEMLRLSGYTVMTATAAADAIERFRRYGAKGRRPGHRPCAARRIERHRPGRSATGSAGGLPVLLITGYSEALLDQSRTGGMPVLTKPFSHAVLARAVGQAVRRGRHDAALARAFEPAG